LYFGAGDDKAQKLISFAYYTSSETCKNDLQ